ncbi:MAG: 50S ribosomal protein L5, partial [Planctomycetes bacterium]|nr:50S ribosomal protein L5 [Planctomycetota bacterium]
MVETENAREPRVAPRLAARYTEKIAPALREEFSYGNPMMIPRLQKVVINMGIGRALENKKRIDEGVKDLATIAGQRPVITRARVSLANFKLREGNAIGCSVTLRGDRMWEFIDRLIAVAIPRIRD